MANLFTALPAPAANGSGAAVDVSAYGAKKTFTVALLRARTSPSRCPTNSCPRTVAQNIGGGAVLLIYQVEEIFSPAP